MRQVVGVDVGGYSFNAAAKTVTLTSLSTLALEQVFVIINATRNVIIYNASKNGYGATIAANVLTLVFDTTAHANGDRLLIIIDYPAQLPLPAGASTLAAQSAQTIVLGALLTELSQKTEPADTQLVSVTASALPSGAATEATLALVKAKTDNLDVALSTRNLETTQAAINTNAGAQADAAVTTDVNATVSSKLRGLVKILGLVWDSVNNALKAVGAAASGAAKAGNPVQTGGVFNTTQPTVTTGQVVEAQSTARGAKIVATGVDDFVAKSPTASNFNAQVQGAGASGAAKAGNPVQTGGVFNTTQPTVTTGQTVEQQSSARGAKLVGVGVEGFPVNGDVAHDGVDSGNPVKVGGQARTTNPTAVSDGDRVNSMHDKLGRTVTVNAQVRELIALGNVTLSTTAETTLIAAGAAGVFHDISEVIVANTSGAARRVDFRDSTAGTIRFQVQVAANVSFQIPFPVPFPQGTAANNWTVQLDGASTDVRIASVAVKNT